MSISAAHRAQRSSVVMRTQPLSLAAWGWILWDAGRLPYLLTICTFVFLPYIATSTADNPLAVQIRFAGYTVAGGLAMAMTLPVLVVRLNRNGRRKPFLFTTTVLMVPLLAALWWVKPGGRIASNGGLMIIAVLNILSGYRELIRNPMSPALADPAIASRLSTTALATGNISTVLVLGVVFCGLLLPQTAGAPFAAQRRAGPLVAALLVIAALPLLAWTPDVPGSGIPVKGAPFQALHELGEAVRRIRSDRAEVGLLVARTAYVDGTMALMQFGGIFAAGAIRASAPEQLAVAMLLALGGALGAVLAGTLNIFLGPRRVMGIGIGFLCVWLLARLGKHFFALLLPRPLVAVLYLSLAILGSGAFVGATSASDVVIGNPASRSRIGVHALSGAATAWLAPLLIGATTAFFRSQAAGFVPVVLLLAGGLIGMYAAERD
jgi:MFS transporter, UMF1 family